VSELKLLTEAERPHRLDLFTTWLPRLGVIFAFVFIGGTKFNDDPRGEWFKIFEQIGLGQWFRHFTGAMQVTGALLLLTPWTRTIGAAMLACTMVGAMFVDAFIVHAVGFAFLPFLLLCAIVATWLAGRSS
jgi:hypothetical protein